MRTIARLIILLGAPIVGACDPYASVQVAVRLDGAPARGVPVTLRCPPGDVFSLPEQQKLTELSGDVVFGRIGCLPKACEVQASIGTRKATSAIGTGCQATTLCDPALHCRRSIVTLVLQ
jgi:hypothetical protein